VGTVAPAPTESLLNANPKEKSTDAEQGWFAFSFVRQLTTWHCPHSAAARLAAVRSATAAAAIRCCRSIAANPPTVACADRMGQTHSPGMLTRPAGHEAEARHVREQLSVYEHED